MKMIPEEIIDYCQSGVLESVTAEQLLQVVGFYEKEAVSPTKEEVNYDTGWEDGYLQAIDEMKAKLDTMVSENI